MGTLAHRVFTRHLSAGPIEDDSFAQACREEIGGSALNHRLGELGIRPSQLLEVIEEVRSLYARFVSFPGEGLEGAEVTVEHSWAGDVALVGTIDAVYRGDGPGVRLVDWKTGELGDCEPQLSFYAALWAMDTGEMPASVEAVSVRTGERLRATPTRERLQALVGEIARLVSEMRRSWQAGASLGVTGGPWCSHCPLLEECGEGRSALALLG